jgi:hypothetical protein
MDFRTKSLFRLLFLFQGACWSSLFSRIEKARFSLKLSDTKIPDDPIFIIGHWRTGSTFLHQLMSLDPNLHAPTLFEVALPDSFLVSDAYYRPVFNRIIGRHRPMDQVKIGMDEPQEDEYAILRITSYSPLEQLVFQNSGHYFLNPETKFSPAKQELPKWTTDYKYFFRKLFFLHQQRIISKNPFNSFRINLLLELFPKAKFIHIHRHPFRVVPSAIHMWDILSRQNSLTRHTVRPSVGEVVPFLNKLLTTIDEETKKHPIGTIVDIRYEDIENDPVKKISGLYNDLNLPFSDSLTGNINNFIDEMKHYKKNEFSLSEEDQVFIRKHLAWYMEKMKYQ